MNRSGFGRPPNLYHPQPSLDQLTENYNAFHIEVLEDWGIEVEFEELIGHYAFGPQN